MLLDSGRNLHVNDRTGKKPFSVDINVEGVRKYTANRMSILFLYYSHT